MQSVKLEDLAKNRNLRDEFTKRLYQRRLEKKIISNPINGEDYEAVSWGKVKSNTLEAAHEAIWTRAEDGKQKPHGLF